MKTMDLYNTNVQSSGYCFFFFKKQHECGWRSRKKQGGHLTLMQCKLKRKEKKTFQDVHGIIK